MSEHASNTTIRSTRRWAIRIGGFAVAAVISSSMALAGASAEPPPSGSPGRSGVSLQPVPPDTTKAHKTNRAPAPMPSATVAPASVTIANTYDVNSSGDGSDSNVGDGLCADSTGACTLRAAVEEANASGSNTVRIFVPAAMTIALGSTIPITNSMEIDGGDVVSSIVNGGGTVQLFSISGASSVAMSGLTLQNGSISGNGGAIHVSNSSLTISGVAFVGNTATSNGGAIHSLSTAQVWVSGSYFGANSAAKGAAIYNDGALSVVDSIFGDQGQPNTAAYGGALYASNSASIDGSRFSYNSASTDGGAIYSDFPLQVVGTAFDHNSATTNGGAIYVSDYQTQLRGSTLSANTATKGGAVYNGYVLQVIGSQLNDNTATYEGGAIYNVTSLHVTASSLAGNTAGDSTTDAEGGAILHVGDLATLETVTITGSQANAAVTSTARGAAISARSYTSLVGVTVNGSAATGGSVVGGAIYAQYDFNANGLSVTGTTVNAVNSVQGGGLYTSSYGAATGLAVDDTTVNTTATSAWVQGGALYSGDYFALDTASMSRTSVNAPGSTSWVEGGGVYGFYPGTWDHVVIDAGSVTADLYIAGAGLYLDDYSTLRNSAVTNNRGTVTSATTTRDSTGGVYFLYPGTVINTTIAGNSIAMADGATGHATGGAYNGDNNQWTNVTVVGNSVTGSTATLTGGVWADFPYSLSILNTIVANNTAPQCTVDGTLNSKGHNLSSDTSCGFTAVGDQEGVDPVLGPLQNNGGNTLTMLPLSGSPALDTGTPQGAPNEDQRGVSRPQGAGFDIGAAEAAGTANSKLVQQIYRDLLGRSGDPAGVGYWSSLLDGGTARSDVAGAIAFTDEYRAYGIDGLYRNYLGRGADAAGVSFWTDLLRGGLTWEQLRTALLASDEYYTNAGGTDPGFINALYVDVVHRPVDPSGSAYWQAQMAGGVSRGDVAWSVVNSDEGRRVLVGGWYDQLLRRPADGGGSDYFVGLLGSGVRDEVIIAALTGSTEYYNYAQTH